MNEIRAVPSTEPRERKELEEDELRRLTMKAVYELINGEAERGCYMMEYNPPSK